MQDEYTYTFNYRCAFCFSGLFMFPEEDYVPTAIDVIRCGNCGKNNEFASLQRVMDKKIEGVIEDIANEAVKSMEKEFKKMGFK